MFEARQTLRSLLLSKDPKVRYLAAKDIVDRAEGKAVARVDMTVREDKPSLTDGQMQLAFSLMRAKGIGFAEAVTWIQRNPDESDRWIRQNAIKTGMGREVRQIEPPSQPEQPKALEAPVSSTDASEAQDPSPKAPSKPESLPGPSNGLPEPKPTPVLAFVDQEP